MNEHFLYYWSMWMIFIIIYFFMPQNKNRSILIAWVLLLILCTDQYILIDGIQYSVAFFLLIVGAIVFYVYRSVSMYQIMVTFIVMIAYIAILMWKKITPVWFFMPSYFMIAVMSVMLILFLMYSFYGQLSVALVGLSFGHFIYELLMMSYKLHVFVGERIFFIHVSLTILLLFFIHFTQIIISKITKRIRRNIV